MNRWCFDEQEDFFNGGVKDGLLLNFAKNKGIVKSESRIKFRFISTHYSKQQLCWYQKMSRILNNGLKR